MKRSLKIEPFDQLGGSAPTKKNFRGSPFIRNTPEYEIILKLGRIKGYDEGRRILGSDGSYVPGSDISMLLNEVMSPNRVLKGMDEFIKLLAKAKIDHDLILNDNIKAKLVKYKRQQHNKDSDDIIPIPAEEVHRHRTAGNNNDNTNKTTAAANNQPRITLERINLDDYSHLLGRERSGTPRNK